MAEVIATHENVFTDCSYMPPELMSRLGDFDWRGRLMFGSDFPAYHAYKDVGFTKWYRGFLSLQVDGNSVIANCEGRHNWLFGPNNPTRPEQSWRMLRRY